MSKSAFSTMIPSSSVKSLSTRMTTACEFYRPGVAGVRLILENGAYVITVRGKYHFSGIALNARLGLDESTPPRHESRNHRLAEYLHHLGTIEPLRNASQSQFQGSQDRGKGGRKEASTPTEAGRPPDPYGRLRRVTLRRLPCSQAASKLVLECEQPLPYKGRVRRAIRHPACPAAGVTTWVARAPGAR